MYAYVSSSTERITAAKNIFGDILNVLKKNNYENTNQYLEALILDKQNPDINLHSLHRVTKQRIKKSSILICDISNPSITMGALIEYAVNQNIPVLCLCDIKMSNHLPTLVKYYDSKILTLLIYSEDTLEYELDKYLKNFKPSKIKFNVFINPDVDNYMNWYSHKHGTSKSEFFRELVGGKISSDKDYKKDKE